MRRCFPRISERPRRKESAVIVLLLACWAYCIVGADISLRWFSRHRVPLALRMLAILPGSVAAPLVWVLYHITTKASSSR